MTNLEALYLTIFIVGSWIVFGYIALEIRKLFGSKISKKGAILIYSLVLMGPLIAPFFFGLI